MLVPKIGLFTSRSIQFVAFVVGSVNFVPHIANFALHISSVEDSCVAVLVCSSLSSETLILISLHLKSAYISYLLDTVVASIQ